MQICIELSCADYYTLYCMAVDELSMLARLLQHKNFSHFMAKYFY